MYVMPAEHKNLILSANGAGKILFNDHELDNLVSSVSLIINPLSAMFVIFNVHNHVNFRYVIVAEIWIQSNKHFKVLQAVADHLPGFLKELHSWNRYLVYLLIYFYAPLNITHAISKYN